MNTRLASRAAEERALFEQAKAKLEEAFVLLRSIEGRLDAMDARSPWGPMDAAQRAKERAQLLDYVEEAQREALRMARRSRRLSRIRARAKTPATVERERATTEKDMDQVEAVIDDLPSAFDDTDEAGDPSQHAKPASDPIERANAVERMFEEVARAVQVKEHPSAPLHREPFFAGQPVLAPVAEEAEEEVEVEAEVETSAETLAERAAQIFAAAADHLERRNIEASAAANTDSDRAPIQLVDVVEIEVEEITDDDFIPEDITDEELEAFEAAMVASAAATAVKWWPAVSESAEAEKAGARMRRDRSPTEVMDRPTLTHLQRLRRLLTARTAVVVIASAVLGTLIGLTLRAVRAQDTTVTTETLRLPFVGPPSELAAPPDLEPPALPEVQTRTTREARPASNAPAIKAPPKCASAKCRTSSSGQAKKTKAAATAAEKLESKKPLSAGLTGSVPRRATTSVTPTTPASKSVVIAQGRSF